MKKISMVISGILIFVLLIQPVKADTIINIQYGGSNYSEYYYLNNLNWNEINVYDSLTADTLLTDTCNSQADCYSKGLTYFSQSGKQYYSVYLDINPNSSPGHIIMNFILFDFSSSDLYDQSVYSGGGSNISRFYFDKTGNNYSMAVVLSGWSDPSYNNFYMYYDSNFNFINSGDYVFKGFYDNENDNYNNMLQVHEGESMPKIKELIQYNSWSEYEQNHLENYTEVNLDNYKYVLLSLKDYNQVQAFQTNLQIKGQIGITPIYNYGQTSKDSATGVQVQDRCNLEYENYTSYPFYILQSDIQNNAIYAIKECRQGSSFKFNNTIFDITYITAENEENPTITINGKTYNVIPYGDLPSTATKNEEDNYIPGESENAITGNTVGLNAIIKNVQQKMSEIWGTFTYFTDFVGQLFSSLPIEIRTILLSAFTIGIILGLIRIFLGK